MKTEASKIMHCASTPDYTHGSKLDACCLLAKVVFYMKFEIKLQPESFKFLDFKLMFLTLHFLFKLSNVVEERHSLRYSTGHSISVAQ